MSSSYMELETLLRAKTSANEPEFKLALTRLAAEVKSRLTKDSSTSVEFFSATLRALSRVKGTAHASIRLQCFADSGVFFYENGLSIAALDVVRHATDLAKRANKKRWLRKIETMAGIVNADLGNVAGAVICYANALTVARDLNDLAGEGSVMLNLGTALIYGGLFREAISCFEKAIEFSLREDVIEAFADEGPYTHASLRLLALSNIAQSHYYLGEYEQGLAAITKCLSASSEPTNIATTVSRVIREFTYVRLALRLHKLEDARKHTELCELYGNAGGRRARSHGDVTRGLYEVYAGDPYAGIAILKRALDLYGDVPSLRADALEALVEAHEQVGQPGPALEFLNALLIQIREARERGIVTLLSLPQLDASNSIAHEADDLRAFKSKELELRVKVAEGELVNARIEILERLAVAADLKEESSGKHGYRVGKLASLLGENLGWNRDACYAIDLAARLHDIGKIGMPDRILLNSKELKEAERHFINTHTTVGAELLSKSNNPQLRIAEEIALHHHEWWNGAGYPSKLAGKRIPIHARIVALCDVFDALTHGRPYAELWSIDRALQEISGRRATQFDPDLTDAFLDLIGKLRKEHSDLDTYLGRAGQTSAFLAARDKIRELLTAEHEQEQQADALAAHH